MSWGYWNYPSRPLIDRWKWFDTRHMTHVCERWAKDRNHNLQAAWFNGVGYEVWENVWSIWNAVTPRDGELIRRVGTVMRFLGSIGYLTSAGWVPHAPAALQPVRVAPSRTGDPTAHSPAHKP